MRDDHLAEIWTLRNAAAASFALTEEQMRRAVRDAGIPELIALIETFSPARSTGPEWTRTFEPLIERLWAWRDDETLAALANSFRARGMAWMAATHALSPENGVRVPAAPRRPAWAAVRGSPDLAGRRSQAAKDEPQFTG